VGGAGEPRLGDHHVLLENDGVLPLPADTLLKIAW
jgi:hypothetical protein